MKIKMGRGTDIATQQIPWERSTRRFWPMTCWPGESGGVIPSEPKIEAMVFALAIISVREEIEIEVGCCGEGGDFVCRNSGRCKPRMERAGEVSRMAVG
jgi:hypothetical protein